MPIDAEAVLVGGKGGEVSGQDRAFNARLRSQTGGGGQNTVRGAERHGF